MGLSTVYYHIRRPFSIPAGDGIIRHAGIPPEGENDLFNGFTAETQKFYWELMFHNERPWFLEHRAEFETALREPFEALAADTRAEMNRRHPDRPLQLHTARIYRDARRLHGRGPYKEHLWFSLKDWQGLLCGPMFWFEIGAADYSYGMGFYDAAPAQMEAWRAYVDANPAAVERLARAVREQKVFSLSGPDYKRPKGERGELLNPWYNKRWLGLDCTHDFGGALFSPELPRILADGYDFLMPYYELFSRFYREGEEKR